MSIKNIVNPSPNVHTIFIHILVQHKNKSLIFGV